MCFFFAAVAVDNLLMFFGGFRANGTTSAAIDIIDGCYLDPLHPLCPPPVTTGTTGTTATTGTSGGTTTASTGTTGNTSVTSVTTTGVVPAGMFVQCLCLMVKFFCLTFVFEASSTNDSKQDDSTGVIAGVVVGVVVVFLAGAVVGFIYLRKKKNQLQQQFVQSEDSRNSIRLSMELTSYPTIKNVEIKERLGGGMAAAVVLHKTH